METVEYVVTGAGVVGLAIARQLAEAGFEVLLLESEQAIGTGISSRNSEVIHAGIYYPKGSLMARLCVAGREKLYAYCREKNLDHAACGKLIVATNAGELAQLGFIAARAAANGVADIQPLTEAQMHALEPQLSGVGALLSPSTGIIDSHGFMHALLGDMQDAGGLLALNCKMLSARVVPGGLEISTGGAEPTKLRCKRLINAAGLGAIGLAANIEGLAPEFVPRAYYAKGNYFALRGISPFARLVYPVPVPGGLGLHYTLDLAGQGKFGPDVEWVDGPDYTPDPGRADAFYAAIRRYWPGLPDDALYPSYAGIRPKIAPPGAPAQDFVIQGADVHGIPGLINLFGIESPGLTAALALAELTAHMALHN